jgi:hypothetical protein
MGKDCQGCDFEVIVKHSGVKPTVLPNGQLQIKVPNDGTKRASVEDLLDMLNLETF